MFFFWFIVLNTIVNVALIFMNTKVLIEMLVLKNCGSFEIQCFPVITVALLWCTEAEFRLDLHSADWNPQNKEHSNRVRVFQHLENLILTLLMSVTEPQWTLPNWGFNLNDFMFAFSVKLSSLFLGHLIKWLFLCLGFALKAGFSLLLRIFGWLSHSVFSFTIESKCV